MSAQASSLADTGHSTRERWLLVFNCQAYGLGTCLNWLCPDIKVDFYAPAEFRKHKAAILETLDHYHRIVVAIGVAADMSADFGTRENVIHLPGFLFSGFHPDLCLVADSTGAELAQFGNFHSALVIGAYRNGLDVRQVSRLFRDGVFEAMGYFDRWSSERANLVRRYARSGLDIERDFVKWSRGGQFMHIPNHPNIRCLRDIARLLLLREGLPVLETELLPPDNLIRGPVHPVYPEIGSKIGVYGNHLFKLGGQDRLVDLEQFISESFACYRNVGPIVPRKGYEPLLDRATSVVEEFK